MVSLATWWQSLHTDPDSDLREVSPRCNLFACSHIGVAVALERRFQVLELLTGEVSALTTLTTAAAATSGAAGPRQWRHRRRMRPHPVSAWTSLSILASLRHRPACHTHTHTHTHTAVSNDPCSLFMKQAESEMSGVGSKILEIYFFVCWKIYPLTVT